MRVDALIIKASISTLNTKYDILIDKARLYYTNDMNFLNIITYYYLLLYFTDIIGNVA
jgi:hypothetical protein